MEETAASSSSVLRLLDRLDSLCRERRPKKEKFAAVGQHVPLDGVGHSGTCPSQSGTQWDMSHSEWDMSHSSGTCPTAMGHVPLCPPVNGIGTMYI